MTGIGYDPHKVGGELTSVTKLLTDPKLKGKITLLTEFADTVGSSCSPTATTPPTSPRRRSTGP